MLFYAVDDPAKLLLERRYRKEFCSKHRFVSEKNMVSAIFNKTMDEMLRKMVEDVLLRAQKDQRIVQKKKGFAVVNVNLVSMNGR